MEFKDRLEEVMLERHLSQADIVRLTGFPKATISRYCSGKSSPRMRDLCVMAKMLNVSDEWLMGYDVSRERKEYFALTEEEENFIRVFRRLSTDGRLKAYGDLLKRLNEETE